MRTCRCPETPGDLQATDVGQPDVEDDHVDRVARGAGHGVAVFARGARVDDMTLFLEQSLEEAAEAVVVFHDQEVHIDRRVRHQA